MSADQAPMGASATVNFKMPLGFKPAAEKKASYGLTFGYGQRLNGYAADGRIATRQTKLADIRFTDSFKLYKAEVASFDLANLDKDKRLNMGPDGGKDSTWLIIGAIALGVGLWLILDDDDDCDIDDLDCDLDDDD